MRRTTLCDGVRAIGACFVSSTLLVPDSDKIERISVYFERVVNEILFGNFIVNTAIGLIKYIRWLC